MHRHLAISIALVFVLACCGNGPTAAPSSTSAGLATPGATAPLESRRPAAEVYPEIRDAVEAIRGLKPTAAVEPVVIDEVQLRKNFEAEFDAVYSPALLKNAEDMLIALGLLPKGASLRKITLDFQAGQVAGYYSPDKDELFVVSRSGGVGPVEEATYAHEFTHQLQDQHHDLSLMGLDSPDQSDRGLARLALIEGDAVSVQSTWMIENLDAKELGELLAASLDPAAVEALKNAPAYLRDTATFPYQDGLAYVSSLLARGGYDAVEAAFADGPDSTEQVLHPEKYHDGEVPIKVALPTDLAKTMGSGWTLATQDTLGELILRIWLREGGASLTESRQASAGWGGDRLALLRGPNGEVDVGLITEWDTAADAEEFAAAARTALTGMGLIGEVRRVANVATRIVVVIGARASDVGAALGAEPGG